MTHFAEVDKNGAVMRVIVATQDFIDTASMGDPKNWMQCAYDGSIRKNYPGIGYTYDKTLDAFIPPKPYASWILDEQAFQWKPPTSKPVDGKEYAWSEKFDDWREVLPITVCEFPDKNNASFVKGLDNSVLVGDATS